MNPFQLSTVLDNKKDASCMTWFLVNQSESLLGAKLDIVTENFKLKICNFKFIFHG